MTIAAHVGREVRRWREVGEFTQQEIATAAGMSRSMIAMLEGGNVEPSLSTLYALAVALGVKPCALLPESA